MANRALFSGLIYDEKNNPVPTANVGNDSYYIVDDDGFKRHIASEELDKQILHLFTDQIAGNEDYIANEAGKMTGKNDLFSIAIFKNQLKNIDKEIDAVFTQPFPTEVTEMLGMTGFHVTIDIHGNIVDVNYPSHAGRSSEE